MKFNLSAIKNIVIKSGKGLILDAVNERSLKKFNAIKELLLSEVQNHPVSQELYYRSSPSKFLTGSRNASLFGFIGFPVSYNPIDDLVDFLDQNINFIPANKLSLSGLTYITYSIPSKDDFNVRFPLFWSNGFSWVNGIEEGISGLGYFLTTYTSSASRSTEGIQSKYPVNPGAEFSGTPFLTPLFEKFKQRLQK